ncbi:MAG: DNA adenine methylase [Bacteroidia bacterium]|nr:DNA adenine methylase [Bacteroidia bacterium]MDW8157959.1 DNA adenine methylase [Bacteroidia bacterium]
MPTINYKKESYLAVRTQFNEMRRNSYLEISEAAALKAAQFIFLNKTCFNGLFRLNARGEFNVPFGKYTKVRILEETNILAASKVLQKAKLICSNYSLLFSD